MAYRRSQPAGFEILLDPSLSIEAWNLRVLTRLMTP